MKLIGTLQHMKMLSARSGSGATVDILAKNTGLTSPFRVKLDCTVFRTAVWYQINRHRDMFWFSSALLDSAATVGVEVGRNSSRL